MIGLIIQYVLYGLLWVTVLAVVGGLYTVIRVRRGSDFDLSNWLGALSLIAGTAPYVGLFGTVWHIIEALSGIGTGNLNVAAIAQPIGQALYATLWGLGSAIPALVGHRVILMLVPADDVDESPSAAVGETKFEAGVEAARTTDLMSTFPAKGA
jgi:hypothetical protein